MPKKYRPSQAHVSDTRKLFLCSKVGIAMFNWKENEMLTSGNAPFSPGLSVLMDAASKQRIMDILPSFTVLYAREANTS